jgi:hypothetical protein
MLVTGVLSPAGWTRRLYIELGMSDRFANWLLFILSCRSYVVKGFIDVSKDL